MNLTQTVAPTETAISVDEVRDHARIDGADDLNVVKALIDAATDWVENETNRQLVTATWVLRLDDFPLWAIHFDKAPLQSITSISYLDTDGASQTLTENTDFIVGANRHIGVITPAVDQTWPATQNRIDAATITFVAGYGARGVVPRGIKQAMLLLCAHWYENREALLVGSVSKELELSVQSLIDQYMPGHYR